MSFKFNRLPVDIKSEDVFSGEFELISLEDIDVYQELYPDGVTTVSRNYDYPLGYDESTGWCAHE